jgi:hypothetical protein
MYVLAGSLSRFFNSGTLFWPVSIIPNLKSLCWLRGKLTQFHKLIVNNLVNIQVVAFAFVCRMMQL